MTGSFKELEYAHIERRLREVEDALCSLDGALRVVSAAREMALAADSLEFPFRRWLPNTDAAVLSRDVDAAVSAAQRSLAAVLHSIRPVLQNTPATAAADALLNKAAETSSSSGFEPEEVWALIKETRRWAIAERKRLLPQHKYTVQSSSGSCIVDAADCEDACLQAAIKEYGEASVLARPTNLRKKFGLAMRTPTQP